MLAVTLLAVFHRALGNQSFFSIATESFDTADNVSRGGCSKGIPGSTPTESENKNKLFINSNTDNPLNYRMLTLLATVICILFVFYSMHRAF